MPHTKSAKKSMRQDAKRRERNRVAKKGIKTSLKKFTASTSAAGTPAEQTQADYIAAIKKLDKAAARKVIHPNAAARKKSQLARQLAKASEAK
jgi:small subunit ribosomal protein S20